MEALLGVKSVAQMIELQTGYFRKQAEMMADQAKTMQEAAQASWPKTSQSRPRQSAEKAMNEIKAA
jgi:hypothetical protein